MGTLENGVLSLKRDPLLKSSSRNERNSSFVQRPRSRFSRFMVFKKIDYLQWVCAVAVFVFFMFVFQMFLPLSTVEKDGDDFLKQKEDYTFGGDLKHFLKEIGGLDFGEGVKFEPTKILHKFQARDVHNLSSGGSRKVVRFGHRKPQLAFVFADLLVDPQHILMVSVATALRAIGYEIEVYSLEDGPVHAVWKNIGVPVTFVEANADMKIMINWLNYDAILVNSLEAKDIIAGLLQEPFKSLPLIWTIHEKTLATRFTNYVLNRQMQLINDWKAVLNRATIVVFPNHALPMFYAAFDSGNYFVIPGSPSGACKLDNLTTVLEESRVNMNIGVHDFVIAITGSQFLYKGLWLEHALVLQALSALLAEFPVEDGSSPRLRIIILSPDITGNYSSAIKEIASNLNYPNGTVNLATIDENMNIVLSIADLVIYGSFLEEQSFPDVLIKAMCLEKPIVAPDLSIIKKYVDDKVNGYLFPKENIKALTQILLQSVSKGRLSSLARNIASIGKHTAKNMMVSESVEGYASLIENVLNLPSEAASPRPVSDIPANIKTEWQWRLFEAIEDRKYVNRSSRVYSFLNKVEKRWNRTRKESSSVDTSTDDTFLYSIWEEEKSIQTEASKKRREYNELRDRSEQPRGTWEAVYRSAKRADRNKNVLHERDDGELERTGQPLTIYEPYFGQGAWSFLHQDSLYRGLGLSTKGRRPRTDDIDGPSRLPLLSVPYYRDALGDFGAFLAIANRIDRIHKNSWIGFSSWRATAKKASLSNTAKAALLEDIQARRHGDALYFWVRMDKDPRNPIQQDFWTFCDAINAGNCKSAFSESLKKMYGVKDNSTFLPPMPVEGGDSWSVMNSWTMPTKSFLEFVMFSRMFVDALDAQFFDEHHQSGFCYLSLSKDRHCYSRILEFLVNVWAYHSARRMVYIDPTSGTIQEQHDFKRRRGKMWIKWFSYRTLKSMDEDLAEEADSDHPKKRWLWPQTGEVFCQGMYERERSHLKRLKEKRKQKSKDKIQRIKNRTHQKVLGKYVKPPPENETVNNPDGSDPIVAATKLLR